MRHDHRTAQADPEYPARSFVRRPVVQGRVFAVVTGVLIGLRLITSSLRIGDLDIAIMITAVGVGLALGYTAVWWLRRRAIEATTTGPSRLSCPGAVEVGFDGALYDIKPTPAQIADGTDPAGFPLSGELDLSPSEIRIRPSRGSRRAVSKRIQHPVEEPSVAVDTLASAEVVPRRWSATLVVEDDVGRRFACEPRARLSSFAGGCRTSVCRRAPALRPDFDAPAQSAMAA
jgi:hypothetical protein